LANTSDVGLFEPAGDWLAGQTEPASQTGAGRGARPLEEGQRVAAALSDDPVADGPIQFALYVLQQQSTRIADDQPADGQLGEAGEEIVAEACPRGSDRGDPFGQ
jgi:hypothetical protein